MRALSRLTGLVPAKGVERAWAGSVELRLYCPRPTERSGALLWIHGGGYVLGTAAQDDSLCRYFATEAGVLVASVEYRLAPQHAFPAPLEDCYAALMWLNSQPGVDRRRIAVAGASAGGGLAAALSLLSHERGEVELAFQMLAYPMLDDRTSTRTDLDESGFRLWNNRSNRFGWKAYTGREPGGPDVPPLAAPARYENLAGLPPAWIGVGTLDLFHDEDVAYADRLRAAGVPCELVTVPGVFHGFDAVAGRSGVAKAFRGSQLRALQTALKP